MEHPTADSIKMHLGSDVLDEHNAFELYNIVAKAEQATKGCVVFTWKQFHFITLMMMEDHAKSNYGCIKLYFYPKNGFITSAKYGEDFAIKVPFISFPFEYYYIDFNAYFAQDWKKVDEFIQSFSKPPSFVLFNLTNDRPSFFVVDGQKKIIHEIPTWFGGGRMWSQQHAQPYTLSTYLTTNTNPNMPPINVSWPIDAVVKMNIFLADAEEGIYCNKDIPAKQHEKTNMIIEMRTIYKATTRQVIFN